MSDNEESEKPFSVDRAKTGKAGCKKCKQKIEKGELRLAKVAPNMFGSGKMKLWHHVQCIFEVFMKQRPTTKRIENPEEDIGDWDNISDDDQKAILDQLEEFEKAYALKHGSKVTSAKKTPTKSPAKKVKKPADINALSQSQGSQDLLKNIPSTSASTNIINKDNYFREFRRLCADITNVSSYKDKTALVSELFTKGRDGSGFKGDIKMWCRLLLPGVVKRIYNLQSKQLIKLFSRICDANVDDMLEHLEEGDVAETVQVFFEKSKKVQPIQKSIITIKEVDDYLEELSKLTKEEEQTHLLKKIAKKCTSNDLKIVVRLIKHDLKINAGAKHILEGVHCDAYTAFQASRDLDSVLEKAICLSEDKKVTSPSKKGFTASINLMVPVLPMLAEACKSIHQAMKKCPNGMYSEIKYDGERVQLHKRGSEFKYFSRSLKPVVEHKVKHFKDFIPQAFPYGKDLILDGEILMIDTNTGKPLPFGSLGVHKKDEFRNANVCLFVFDCIYYNDEILVNKPIKERRRILKENMVEVTNHIMFSELEEIHKPHDLAKKISQVLKLGLEGLVVKDLLSTYEPGKRHWLKIKKDYLCEGAMADSADLIVLGAWYGTGKKGGMMSVFLMGCYDPFSQTFRTVTKVHTGHDDETLERLQTELDMIKISGDVSNLPDWLDATKTMVPDFVARDPKKQPVWEISGAEFTKHEVHTANGISVRFPRVTKIRDDKNWETATNLQELEKLFHSSNDGMDTTLLNNLMKECDDLDIKPNNKKKKIPAKRKINDNASCSSSSNTSSNIKKEKDETSSVKSESTEEDNKGDLDFKKGKRKLSYDDMNVKKIKIERYSDCSTSRIKKEENSPVLSKPLPDVFVNIKAFIPEKLAESNEELVRYFIAFGGIIVSKKDIRQCTHFIHDCGTAESRFSQCPRNSRHVVKNWLIDSIKRKKLQETKKYAVTLTSSKVTSGCEM